MHKGYIVTCLALGCMGAHLYPSRPQMTNEHNAKQTTRTENRKKTVKNLSDRCCRDQTPCLCLRGVSIKICDHFLMFTFASEMSQRRIVYMLLVSILNFAIFIPYFGCHVLVGRSALLDTRQWLIWPSAGRIECCFLEPLNMNCSTRELAASTTRSTIIFETL